MKKILGLILVALIASTAFAQMQLGRVSTNDTIDWRGGDMVKLRFTSKNPTVVLKNYSPGRVKYVQVTTSTGLNGVTFPIQVIWTNDLYRGAGVSPGDTVYYIMTSVDSTIIATKIAEYRLKTWSGPALTSGNYNPYPDTTAPSTVSDLALGSKGTDWASFTFTAPTDDRGVSGYDFRSASGPIAESVSGGDAEITLIDEGHDVAASDTISATVTTSGTNRGLLVGVTHYKWGSETVQSVKVGTTNLTRVATYSHGDVYMVTEIWKLIAPAVGDNTVVATLSSSAEVAIVATAWSGVDQTTMTGNTDDGGGTSTSPSTTVSSSSANTVVDFVTWNVNASNITGTPSGTQIANYGEYPSYNPKIGASYKTGEASTVMSWTLGTSTDWIAISTELLPADAQGDTVLWADATRGPTADPPTSGTQTYTFSGLAGGTAYHVRMKSQDASGNISALSNEVTFTTNAPSSGGGSGFPYGPVISGGSTGYYLSPTGSNANNGKTPATAKQKWYSDGNGSGIRDVLGTEAGYDTVWIRAGTYAEIMDFARGGFSETSPVVVMRYGAEGVTFTGNATDNDNATVRTNYFDNIVIQGIRFECNEIDEYRDGYVVDLTSTGMKFLYNYVLSGKDSTFWQTNYPTSGNGPRALTFGGYNSTTGQYAHNIEIANCYIRGWDIGIVAGDAYDAWIHHDTVHATMWSNIHVTTWSSAYKFDPRNMLIEYCDLDSSFGEDNIQFESHGSNYSDANPWNSQFYVVRNNVMKNGEESAVDLKGCAYVWVYDNVIANSWGNDDGYTLGGYNNGTGDALTIGFNNPPSYYARPFACTYAYNLIYGSCGGLTLTYGGSAYNNTVLNNRRNSLAYNNTDADDAYHGALASNPGYFASSFVNNSFANHYTALVWTVYAGGVNFYIDNNHYYDSSGTTRWRYRTTWPQAPLTLTSLSSWQSHLGGYGFVQWKDAHAKTGRPLFTNGGTTPTVYNAGYNFAPTVSDTVLYQKGRSVTTATNSGSGGTTLRVACPTAFHGPLGKYIEGQRVWVRDATQVARIIYAYFDKDNQSNSYFTLDTPLTWDAGDPVHLAGKPGGSTPNIGAK